MTGDRTAQPRTAGQAKLWALSLLVGIVASLGAVAFRALIGHNLFFLGKLSMAYDANIHTPASPCGRFVILVPVGSANGISREGASCRKDAFQGPKTI